MPFAAGLWAFALMLLGLASGVNAEAGKVTALMGSAILHQEKQVREISTGERVDEGNEMETGEWSKMKLLLTDGGLITLYERTKVKIEDYSYRESEGGTLGLVLGLGSIRVAAGETAVEARTETALVSARDSYFELDTGREEGVPYSTVICMRGTVSVESPDLAVEGSVILHTGYMVTIWKGEGPLAPIPVTDRYAGGKVGRKPKVGRENDSEAGISDRNMMLGAAAPPIQQQPVTMVPVTVNVIFPR